MAGVPGYAGRIAYVDLSRERVRVEEVSVEDARLFLGQLIGAVVGVR